MSLLPPLDTRAVRALFASAPIMTLATPRRATAFLRVAEDDARELSHVLRLYPDVLCEPLDFHYLLLQSLRALKAHGPDLIATLCSDQFGWDGVVWASLLVCVAPGRDRRDPLRAALDKSSHNRWLPDLALAAIEGREAPVDAGFLASAKALREAYAELPLHPHILPAHESIDTLISRQERTREAYREGGAQAAVAFLRRDKQEREAPSKGASRSKPS